MVSEAGGVGTSTSQGSANVWTTNMAPGSWGSWDWGGVLRNRPTLVLDGLGGLVRLTRPLSSVAFFGADGSEGAQGLQRPGGSTARDNTGGLAGESTAAELKDELPVGQLVMFVGALDSVGQLAQVHLRLTAGPALRRTWHSITLPRP